jgi:hypothetical protein
MIVSVVIIESAVRVPLRRVFRFAVTGFTTSLTLGPCIPRDLYLKACLAWVGSHRFAKEEVIAKEEVVAKEAVAICLSFR